MCCSECWALIQLFDSVALVTVAVDDVVVAANPFDDVAMVDAVDSGVDDVATIVAVVVAATVVGTVTKRSNCFLMVL
jgi:hypothetical protein